MEKKIAIEGMSCNHCKMHVEQALGEVPGVRSAVVDLKAKNATVQADESVTNEALTQAVTEAGYEVTGIR
ncbi:MAG: copper ion binding protein [Eubacteriales bacterium]|nr:copper ion binding protein [Eubacteriales bacterium]